MRCHRQHREGYRYDSCRATDLGYECEQKGVQAEGIDTQVLRVLKKLIPSENWRQGVTEAISELLGEQRLEDRLTEAKGIIQRMDRRWDNGLVMDEQEFFQQRI